MYGAFKRAQPYIRNAGRHVTKRHKRPIRRMANSAVDWFEKITGFGDYSVKGNTLMTDNAPPMFQSSGQGIRISHREYLGNVQGSVDFALNSYDIQPGNNRTFPWLAQIAKHFEQYQLNGCVFEFRSTSGDAIASTNNALGVVVMATEYDVLDSPFKSKQNMQQSMFCCSGPTSRNLLHPVECDPSSLPTNCLYVRTESDSGSRDLRFQDLGKFQIATEGQQASVVVGELWISYDITLLKAQPPADDIFNDAVQYAITGVDTNNPFGTSQSLEPGSIPGFIIASSGVGEGAVQFPPGYENTRWDLHYYVAGSSQTWNGATRVLTNASSQTIASGSGSVTSQNGASTRVFFSMRFQTNSSGQANVGINACNPPSAGAGYVLLTRVQDTLRAA